MTDQSVFDGLVASLSSEERSQLLARLKASAPVSLEPLFSAEALNSEYRPPEARLSQLGFFKRLILFFRRLFSGQSFDQLLDKDELKAIARRIELRTPGILDYKRGLLLEGFLEQLKALRDSARFFYDVLDRSVEKEKGAFFAILGSIEMPDVNHRLLEEADPYSLSKSNPDMPEDKIRSALYTLFEEIISAIPEDRRRVMYHDVRSLLFLKRLSCFLFERFINAFKAGASPSGGLSCSFLDSGDHLAVLSDIIFSLSIPPSVELMEALFVFAERDEFGKPSSDVESLVAKQLAKAEIALSKIRAFNARVPLADLARLSADNPELKPRELAGGEDWLAIYKAFWKEHIEARLNSFREERRYTALADEISVFIGSTGIRQFEHISREESQSAPAVRLEIALSFLDAFYRGPFLAELNRPLKILLVDGEFYRKENRVEYTDAYGEILRLSELLAAFDAQLAPDGEIGTAWVQANLEVAPLQIRHRKMQSITRMADEEAERLVKRIGEALMELGRVIHGVLKGEAGGRYDSLSNLSSLDGKANKEYIRSLNAAQERCVKAARFLSELSGINFESAD